MAYVETVNGEIIARTEYVEKDLIKQVPGSRYRDSVWRMPLSWGSCQALRGIFGERLQVGPQLATWANDEYARRVEPVLNIRTATAYTVRQDNTLFAFQDVDRDFVILGEQTLLGNEMGTGKTRAVTAAVARLRVLGHDPYPVCCVVPNSTKRDPWEDTWRLLQPQAHPVVIGGTATDRRKRFEHAEQLIADGEDVIIIIHWDAVLIHSRLAPYGNIRLARCTEHGGQDPDLKTSRCEVHPKELNRLGFRTVIVDEAHCMKGAQAKRTRAVWSVQHGPTVRWRCSMTGTPIANDLSDLWPIMHGLAPQDYPTKTEYIDRYALLGWDYTGGINVIGVNPTNRDEFFRIFDARFRRMPKDLVLRFLPPKLRQRRYAEMSTKQAKAYRDVAKEMVTQLDDGRLVLATNNLTKQLRLLQFSSSYAEVDEAGKVRLSEPSPKLDVMMEIAAELGSKPFVVCAESRQLIELAAARLERGKIPFSLIVGGMTDDQRYAALRDFQEGRVRAMLFTLKAGGIGLTMTAADTIIFLQRSWSMLDNKQSEDRVHRIGAERHESIHIIDVVAPGTIEEDQITRLYEKFERLQEIVRDRETLRAAGLLDQVARLEAEEELILSSELIPSIGGPV